MVASLRHRGPDHQAIWLEENIGLVHTRLSILDISSAADQPFSSADGRYLIVYNGELYNFRELRKDLSHQGRVFRTECDTEVVLEAVIAWGQSALKRMNGMFAFAVFDKQERVLFAARDRFGIKPFHWSINSGKFLFASEVKAIIQAQPGPWAIAAGAPAELLLYHERIAEGLVDGIETLPPGHTLTLSIPAASRPVPRSSERCGPFDGVVPRQDLPRPRVEPWFHVTELPSVETSQRLAGMTRGMRLDLLDETLRAAVGRHLISDVPVGSLCSGGVDSSLLTAIACTTRKDVRVYHVDIADHSERRWAEQVARHLNVELHCFELTRDNYLAGYIKSIWHNDGPLTHPQNVPIAYISELARSHGCKVLLAGEGADEGFGGYDWRYRLRRNYRRFVRYTEPFQRLFRKTLFLSTGVWLQRFDPNWSFRAWANPGEILTHLADRGYRERLEAACQDSYRFIPDAIDREVLAAMTADLRDYINGINHQQDRASMQAGIESRVPFLDIEVTRLAANLPLADKVTWMTSKRLIKALALRYLPPAVVYRPKVGFASPAADYVRTLGLAPFDDGFLVGELGFDRSTVVAMLKQDPGNHTHMLYGLEFWGRLFLRGETPTAVAARYIG